MPKRRRREQQHLRQESSRKRSYTMGGTSHHPAEKYRPGFPMNLFHSQKAFYVIGALAGLSMVFVAVVSATRNNTPPSADDIPTPTATATVDPNATPTPTPTPDPRDFAQAEQVIDAQNKEYKAIFKTNMGDFEISLFADKAPNTVNSFVFLAQKDFFDGLTFHRVLKNFVIQGGDPRGDGTGGPGYTTAEEPNEIRNTRGTVSMAKAGGATDFGSQFFINLKDNPSLDFDNPSNNKFYPFGEVTSGMDVVDKISQVPVEASSSGELSKPVDPVVVNDVVIEVRDKS
ncbi:MAG: peptidylprolyl isomerase [Hyphomicrobiales bacterium]